MKTKRFKPSTTLLFLLPFCMAILLTGCVKEESCSIIPVSGAIDDISGKWKQFKTEQINGGPPAIVYDYSCSNILYSFQEGSILTIESDQIDYLGFETGEYLFSFTKSDNGQIYHTLFINEIEHSCSISEENILTIGLEQKPGPLDLPYTFTTLYFIRTQ